MSESASPGQRDWLRIALDKIGDAVVTTDAQGRVTFMNAAAERLAGTRLDAAQGRPFQDVLPLLDAATRQPLSPDPAAAATYQALLDGTSEARQLTVNVAPCQEGDRECSGAVLVLRDDLTEQKRLQEELRRRAEELVAADANARYQWWFRRTPYWDATVGLLPYFRVMAAPKLDMRAWR